MNKPPFTFLDVNGTETKVFFLFEFIKILQENDFPSLWIGDLQNGKQDFFEDYKGKKVGTLVVHDFSAYDKEIEQQRRETDAMTRILEQGFVTLRK